MHMDVAIGDGEASVAQALERVNLIRASSGARLLERLPLGCFVGTHHPVSRALGGLCPSLRIYPAEHLLPWWSGDWPCLTAVQSQAAFLTVVAGKGRQRWWQSSPSQVDIGLVAYCRRKSVVMAPDWLAEFVTLFAWGRLPNLVMNCAKHYAAHQRLIASLNQS